MELEDKLRERNGQKNGDVVGMHFQSRKRPISAYALFFLEHKDKFKENSSLRPDQINKLAAYKWNNLPEEEKNVYKKKFTELKQFYEEQDRERELNGDNSVVRVKKEDENRMV